MTILPMPPLGPDEPALERAIRFRRAVFAAAVQRHGWGRSRGWKLNPTENWQTNTTDAQKKACVSLTEPIIEAFVVVYHSLRPPCPTCGSIFSGQAGVDGNGLHCRDPYHEEAP